MLNSVELLRVIFNFDYHQIKGRRNFRDTVALYRDEKIMSSGLSDQAKGHTVSESELLTPSPVFFEFSLPSPKPRSSYNS